jgi:hypothetical protein
VSALGNGWNRFWFERRSIAPLVLLRSAFGFLVFLWAVSIAGDATTFFGHDGVLGNYPTRPAGWNLLELWTSDTAVIVLVTAIALGGLCLAVGVASRPASVVVFAGIISMAERNPWIGNGGDGLLRALAFYVMVAAFATGGFAPGRGQPYARRAVWPLRLIQVQMSVLYLATVWAKLRGTTWPHGTAVGYAFRFEDLGRFPLPDVTAWLPAANAITWAVVGVELALGVLVWFRKLRPWVLLAGVCLHLGIEYRLRVGFFSWAILVTYLAWVTPSAAEAVLRRIPLIGSYRWHESGSTSSWSRLGSSSRVPARQRQ